VIQFDSVSMRYGNGDEILKNLTFTLDPGSFHFLTGASGAGKTSLLKLLYLDQKPSHGDIQFFDTHITPSTVMDMPKIRRKIGIVFQDFRLFNHLSAFDNVALPLKIIGAHDSIIKDHVTELLTWVGLDERMHAKPPFLSGGEQQRVAIARAIIGKPDLLLADEPTGNVDPEMGLKLMHLFAELNKLGTTTVIATHDEGLVKTIGAPVLHLDKGCLTYEGGS